MPARTRATSAEKSPEVAVAFLGEGEDQRLVEDPVVVQVHKDVVMPLALLAPDSFKGTLSATEVAAALALGAQDAGWKADSCPLADGGEGTAELLMEALGGERIGATATDPLGRPIAASWILLADEMTAIVEVAEASGLALLRPQERDPHTASSYGTGQLIAAAASRAERVLVAAGGSATNDGGRGALDAIAEAGGLSDTRLVCLCDVETPWERASETFGPQKGASADDVAELSRSLDSYASELPRDPRGRHGGGAAGGLAGGLWAALGAELCPGAAYICDALGVDSRIARADLVIGGEGRLDETTLEGKALSELARRCDKTAKPLVAVVGQNAAAPGVISRLGLRAVAEAGDAASIRTAGAALAGRAA